MAKEQREAAAAAAATPLSEVASAVAEAAAVPAAPVTAAAAAAAGAATATAADEPGSAGDAAAAAAEGGKEPEPGQRAAEQDRKRIEESLAAAASWAELNADLLQPHVRHAGDTGAAMKLLEDLAQYLMESVVPRLATELASVDVPVWETNTLRDAFRARGVNMRYAGKVAQLVPAPASVRPVLLQEMVARTARRILRPLLRATAAPHLSAVLATFLNALCGTPKSKGDAAATVTPVIVAENEVVEGLLSQLGVPASAYPVVASKDPVSVPTGAALWAQIVEQTKLHFGYELTAADLAIVRTPALLRTFALRVGIKLRARDYSFAVPTPFTAADILAVQPITKTTLFNSADGAARLQRGRELLRQMHVMEALAVLQSAIHCFGQVTGPVHPAAAATYQTLSSLCMMVGDLIGALDCQQRALLLLEHSSGLDHPEVIQGYTLLASLCAHFTDAHDAAVAYMQRAIYLAAVHTGPNSVAVAQYYIHMASILEEPMPEQAVSYLLAAIRILEQVLGPRHQRVAFQHRNVAMVYALMKKWREATEHMTLFKDVFGELFGPASAPVREAEEALAEIKAQSDPLHIRTSARRQKGPRLTVMEETATNTLPLEDVLSFVNGDAPAPVRAYTAQLAASAQQRTGAVPSGDAPKVDVPEVPMPPAATAATAAATVKGKKRRSAPADAAASAASASASAAAAAPSE